MLSGAFIMGLLGSLHCIGMCGPLVLSLSGTAGSGTWPWLNPIRYNAGRVVTYSFLGLVVALLGEPLRAAGWQQVLSIVGGSVMLFGAVGYILPMYLTSTANPLSLALIRWRNGLFQSVKRAGRMNRFVLGALNGLLPCGLVYMALGAATMQHTFGATVLFMALFGLGTAPVLLLLGYGPSWMHIHTTPIRKAYPYAMMIVAVLLLLRGMNLGIPYISPALMDTAGCAVSCCSSGGPVH